MTSPGDHPLAQAIRHCLSNPLIRLADGTPRPNRADRRALGQRRRARQRALEQASRGQGPARPW